MPVSKGRKKAKTKTKNQRLKQEASSRQNRQKIRSLIEGISYLDQEEERLLVKQESDETKENMHE